MPDCARVRSLDTGLGARTWMASRTADVRFIQVYPAKSEALSLSIGISAGRLMVAASAIIPFYPRKPSGKTRDEAVDTVRRLPGGEPSLAWGAGSGRREPRCRSRLGSSRGRSRVRRADFVYAGVNNQSMRGASANPNRPGEIAMRLWGGLWGSCAIVGDSCAQ